MRRAHGTVGQREAAHALCVPLVASAAQDTNSIYMLLELVQGGELWSLIYNDK